MKSWDAIIVGAGIIGVSLAMELRERGATVLVLDRAEAGSEASSAAAGMLAAADPETPIALRPLATESARIFPAFVQKLESAANMQVDFRRIGSIALLHGHFSTQHVLQPVLRRASTAGAFSAHHRTIRILCSGR